jgi:hypothetical protein
MPRIKRATFVLNVETFGGKKDDAIPTALCKRKRTYGEEEALRVFGIRFPDDWCLRYRPAWKHAGASLMVYEPINDDEDRVWECIRFHEHCETICVDANGRNVSPPRSFLPSADEFSDALLGPHSFFGQLATDVKLKTMHVEHFYRGEEDRATMDLTAVVRASDCRKYYTLRLELMRILN